MRSSVIQLDNGQILLKFIVWVLYRPHNGYVKAPYGARTEAIQRAFEQWVTSVLFDSCGYAFIYQQDSQSLQSAKTQANQKFVGGVVGI